MKHSVPNECIPHTMKQFSPNIIHAKESNIVSMHRVYRRLEHPLQRRCSLAKNGFWTSHRFDSNLENLKQSGTPQVRIELCHSAHSPIFLFTCIFVDICTSNCHASKLGLCVRVCAL